MQAAATFSPLINAPTQPRSGYFSNHASPTNKRGNQQKQTCRIIIGHSDNDFVTTIITPTTTARQVKLEAVMALNQRRKAGSNGSDSDARPESYVIVRRANMRYSPSPSPYSAVVPLVSPLLMQSFSAESRMLPMTSPVLASSLTAPNTTRPAMPIRAAPSRPSPSPSPSSPFSASSSSHARDTSHAQTVDTSTTNACQSSILSVTSLLDTNTHTSAVRLDDSDTVWDKNSEAASQCVELVLEPAPIDNSTVSIRLIEADEMEKTTTTDWLPPPPPVFDTDTGTVTTCAKLEREYDLDAGLDICVMSMHGTYIHSPNSLTLSVSHLDNHTTFTLLDSQCVDENGNPYKYLCNERGEYLSASENGTVFLEDVSMVEPVTDADARSNTGMKDKTLTLRARKGLYGSMTLGTLRGTTTCTRHPGHLHPYHRWSIKRGPCQSLKSAAFDSWLTITEEGELLLTSQRFEESCLHLCFAVLQGELRKKSHTGIKGFRSWQRKYFVLSGSTLTYFNEKDETYNRELNPTLKKKSKSNFNSMKKNMKNETSNDMDTRSYSTAGILSINVYPLPSLRFDVEFINGRVLEVKAHTELDRERWVRALRNGKIGKKMDAKAKEIKKKKEREETLRLRERQQSMKSAMDARRFEPIKPRMPNPLSKRYEEEKESVLSSPSLPSSQPSSPPSASTRVTNSENKFLPPKLRSSPGTQKLQITVTGVGDGDGKQGGLQGLFDHSDDGSVSASETMTPSPSMHHNSGSAQSPSVSTVNIHGEPSPRPVTLMNVTPGPNTGKIVNRRRSLSAG